MKRLVEEVLKDVNFLHVARWEVLGASENGSIGDEHKKRQHCAGRRGGKQEEFEVFDHRQATWMP